MTWKHMSAKREHTRYTMIMQKARIYADYEHYVSDLTNHRQTGVEFLHNILLRANEIDGWIPRVLDFFYTRKKIVQKTVTKNPEIHGMVWMDSFDEYVW